MGLASFEFDLMDAWFEEDEQIWFHARDPFRRVEVTVDGYLPRIDVDWTNLASSATTSGCHYKAVAVAEVS